MAQALEQSQVQALEQVVKEQVLAAKQSVQEKQALVLAEEHKKSEASAELAVQEPLPCRKQ